MNTQSTLVPLKREHIELVRNWRNADWVLQHMEYRKIISEEEQERWFNRVSKSKEQLYYLIKSNDKLIGLAHLSDINTTLKTAQVGLFIGEKDFIGTGSTFSASIQLLDIAFVQLQLKTLYAKVKSTNQVAVQYNAFLGFAFDRVLNDEFNQYLLTDDIYLLKKEKLSALFK